jgi:hypothetical protein
MNLRDVSTLEMWVQVITLFFWSLLVICEITAATWKKRSKLFNTLALCAFAIAVYGEIIHYRYERTKEAKYEDQLSRDQAELQNLIQHHRPFGDMDIELDFSVQDTIPPVGPRPGPVEELRESLVRHYNLSPESTVDASDVPVRLRKALWEYQDYGEYELFLYPEGFHCGQEDDRKRATALIARDETSGLPVARWKYSVKSGLLIATTRKLKVEIVKASLDIANIEQIPGSSIEIAMTDSKPDGVTYELEAFKLELTPGTFLEPTPPGRLARVPRELRLYNNQEHDYCYSSPSNKISPPQITARPD